MKSPAGSAVIRTTAEYPFEGVQSTLHTLTPPQSNGKNKLGWAWALGTHGFSTAELSASPCTRSWAATTPACLTQVRRTGLVL